MNTNNITYQKDKIYSYIKKNGPIKITIDSIYGYYGIIYISKKHPTMLSICYPKTLSIFYGLSDIESDLAIKYIKE